jgi:GTPase SAR1 family protein
LVASFKDEAGSYLTDLQWAKPSEDVPGIPLKDKLGERLTVDRMEKHWVRILFEYSLFNLPINKCDLAWSQLQSGNETACRATLQMTPQAYWESIEFVTPHCDPRYLRAALLVAELLLRDGQSKLARRVMEEAYQNTLVLSNKSNDPLYQNVFILSKLYIGVAEANFEKASIYARQLPNAIGWASRMCRVLPPEPAVDRTKLGSTDDRLRDFLSWIKGLERDCPPQSKNGLSAEIKDFEDALDEDQIRVIVGGETSAGKSTFINRLVEHQILVSDRQESTAVPTHLSYATRWSVRVEFEDGRDSVEADFGCGPECPQEVKSMIRYYGFLGSETSEMVSLIRIGGPMEVLKSGVELIDSPGLNAHSLRTARADKALERSHLCLFVMDARNALKADLVDASSEFDVGGNPLEDVAQYVREQLGSQETESRQGPRSVEVYCVSSIDTGRYEDEFHRLRVRLEESTRSGKQELLLYRAKRLARHVANERIQLAMDAIRNCELQLATTRERLPDNPNSIERYLEPRVKELWESRAAEYLQAIQRSLSTSVSDIRAEVQTGIEKAEDLSKISQFIKATLPDSIHRASHRVSRARNQQWEHLTRLMFEDIAIYFQSLYADIDFEYNVDMEDVLRSATPMPLPSFNGLFSDMDEKVSSIGGQATGGAAAGAAVGAMIGGPIGAVIGAGIGGILVSSSASDTAKEEIIKMVNERISSFEASMNSAIDGDLKDMKKGQPRMISAVLSCIELESNRFASKVQQRIDETSKKMKSIQVQSQAHERTALKAESWRAMFLNATVSPRLAVSLPVPQPSSFESL